MMRTHAPGDEGFTILEMIVAFMILALAMGLIGQSIVLSRRAMVAAETEQRSIRELRGILANLQAGDISLEAGSDEFGDRWKIEKRLVDTDGSALVALKITPNVGDGRPGRSGFVTFMQADPRASLK
ncbi:type II secretion system protein [Mesorhizobium sp. CC13]|uniref:PulJ/GspJ family protein n=1 Tax=Mesorhizobium sp. CC13 TaxID=3029194 RepID=UPI00326758D9